MRNWSRPDDTFVQHRRVHYCTGLWFETRFNRLAARGDPSQSRTFADYFCTFDYCSPLDGILCKWDSCIPRSRLIYRNLLVFVAAADERELNCRLSVGESDSLNCQNFTETDVLLIIHSLLLYLHCSLYVTGASNPGIPNFSRAVVPVPRLDWAPGLRCWLILT